MRFRRSIQVLVCGLCSGFLAPLAPAAILQVPQEYPTIQAGLDHTSDGDTVLVDRGIWTGLLNTPEHTVMLCSNFLFTQDTTDIQTTILDGEYEGSILTLNAGGEDSTVVRGFTLMHGMGDHGYYWFEQEGGAIELTEVSNSVLEDLVFLENDASWGGSVIAKGFIAEPPYERYGDVHIRRIYARGNDEFDPDEEENSQAQIFIHTEGEVILEDVHMQGAGYPEAAIMVVLWRGSVEARYLLIEGLTGGMQLLLRGSHSPSVILAENIIVRECTSIYGVVGLGGSVTEDDGIGIYRNILISDCVTNDSSSGTIFRLYADYITADSIVSMNNRTRMSVSGVDIYPALRSSGQVSRLYVRNNISGDSLEGGGNRVVQIRDCSLYDSEITGNVSIHGGTRYGSAVWLDYRSDDPEDTLHIENCVISDNLEVDIDDYSDAGPSHVYGANLGRALFLDGDPYHAVLRNLTFRNNRQPNHVPEHMDEFGIVQGLGATVYTSLHSRTKLWAENIAVEDCDDGGLQIYAPDSAYYSNIVVANATRSGAYLGCQESGTASNIWIHGIEALDYIPGYWTEQRAYYGGDGLVTSNLTVTGCTMPYLFGPWIWDQSMTSVNAVVWDNNIEGYIWPDSNLWYPAEYMPEFTYSLLQELLPGEGNTTGDPIFDEDYGVPYIASGSPCIDAGNPDPANNDIEDPNNPGFALWPSQGGLRNDMGVTGGPHAGGIPYESVSRPPDVSYTHPERITLSDPYPNPFIPVTHVNFWLPVPCHTNVEIFDLLGRRVTILMDEHRAAGEHLLSYHAEGLASGVYFVRLSTDRQQETKKIILIR